MCEKCQGWKNYETWGINLIISNEQNYYRYIKTLALDAFNGPVIYSEDERIFNAAEVIREYIRETFSDCMEECYNKIPKYKIMFVILEQIIDFSESTTIDFREIAESLLEDEINLMNEKNEKVI